MIRSGSTLQYNIASEIVERSGVGSREIWVDDHVEYFSRPPTVETKVFKSHVMTTSIAKCLTNRTGFAVVSYRDVRDVVASWQKFHYKVFTIDECLDTARSAIQDYSQWEQLPSDRVYVSKYETLFSNLETEIENISRAIDVPIYQNGIEAIVQNLSRTKISNNLRELRDDEITTSGQLKWDSRTLIHLNHLTGGGIVGRYKTEISSSGIKALNSEFGHWLQQHGYDDVTVT